MAERAAAEGGNANAATVAANGWHGPRHPNHRGRGGVIVTLFAPGNAVAIQRQTVAKFAFDLEQRTQLRLARTEK
eukprot:5502096-Lingulodinium_polyedra.AAC.1